MVETWHISQGPTGITGQTAAIPATPTIITFLQPSTQIDIDNQSTEAILYVRYGGSTCTTGDFSIAPGKGFTFDAQPLTQICILGSTASGNYSLLAH